MFNINVKISSLLFVSLFIVMIVVATSPVLAKKVKSDQEKPYDIEKSAYPDNKKGCEMRAGMFVIFAKKYANGEPAKGAMMLRMADPLAENIYDRIRSQGLEQAQINNMKEYSKCIKSAGVHRHAKKERDLTLKHTACVQLNDVILDTLDGIKRRKSPETLMSKYQNANIDTTWTNYAIVPDAPLYLIARLYKESQSKDYSTVVEAASDMSSHCYL